MIFNSVCDTARGGDEVSSAARHTINAPMDTMTSSKNRGSIHRCGLDSAARDYAEEWQLLLDRDRAEPFLGPEWLTATANARDLSAAVEVVLQTEANGNISALMPFLHRHIKVWGSPLFMWETAGNVLVSYHMALLGQNSAHGFLDLAIDTSARRPDVLSLPAVVQGSSWEAALLDFASRRSWTVVSYATDESPYLSIDTGWENFLRSKSSNFRYNLRRKEKALGKLGQVEHRWYSREEDVPALLKAMLDVEAGSWKADADMAITESEMELRYYERLLPFLGRSNALVANVITLDAAPIAYSLCYAWNGKLGQLKTSFVERHSDASPGLVVNCHAIRHAFETGNAEFDFLGDILPHKMHWTDLLRQHTHYYLYSPSLKGRLIGNLKRLGKALTGSSVRHSTLGRGAHRKAQQD